ncbi:MAG: HAD family hydrolase [Planctomycetota bacterium]
MFSAPKAVIFDLDDTLYPEREYAFSGFATVAQAFETELGDPGTTVAEMRRLFDTEHRGRVFDRLIADRGPVGSADLVRQMVSVFREHVPSIRLYVDADAALRRLRSTVRLGLITDGPAGQQWRKIDVLELRGRLDQIIVTSELRAADGSDSLNFAKPHPWAFERMASALGVSHGSCFYVGDNQAKDFVAPNRLGWQSVRVLRSDGVYRDAPPAQGGCASREITSLDELDSLLGW